VRQAALVYGLSSAATTSDGISHWGDTKVLASLSAAVAFLAAFLVIEARSRQALMPMRIFSNRDRSAANLIMLCIGTSMFGLFFFLTLFVEHVWGYSPFRAGVGYLPMVAVIMVMSSLSTQLVPRIGARPLLIAASAIASGGMFWLSRANEHSTYAGGLIGPMLVTGAGLGLLFMPNVGQQLGGALGLGILGTVAWTVVADTARNSAAAAKVAAIAAARAGHPLQLTAAQAKAAQTGLYNHALATGFSRGFMVSAGIMLLALVVAITLIQVGRQDLAGVNPMGG
jgi:hypothetical protein